MDRSEVSTVIDSNGSGDRFDIPAGLGNTTARTHFGRSGEKYLQCCIGENDGPDVTPFDYPTTVCRHPRTLLFAQHRANATDRGDVADGLVDSVRSDLARDIDTVDRHAIFADVDTRHAGKMCDSADIVRLDAVTQRSVSDRPVHRSCVEIRNAEPPRQRTRDGGLARPRGTVDGDDTHRRGYQLVPCGRPSS